MRKRLSNTLLKPGFDRRGPSCPFCGATDEHIGALGRVNHPRGPACVYARSKPFTVRIRTIF